MTLHVCGHVYDITLKRNSFSSSRQFPGPACGLRIVFICCPVRVFIYMYKVLGISTGAFGTLTGCGDTVVGTDMTCMDAVGLTAHEESNEHLGTGARFYRLVWEGNDDSEMHTIQIWHFALTFLHAYQTVWGKRCC